MIEVKSKDCPDRDSLQLLLLGKMTGVDAENLEAHLLQCDQCAAAAEAISLHDDLTDAFRNHRLIEEEADIVNEVIERARRLQSKEETSCVEETVVISSAEPGATSGLPSSATQPTAGKSTLLEVDEALLDCLAPPETPGEIGRLANYRVLEVLGSGGMGIVFLAEDLQLKRQVALKVMQPIAAANREARDRFLREARATAAIEHDHIVSIYQVGEDRGVPFIAMRYIRGESLQTRLEREGRLDQREALRIGRELADGLTAAHKRGLIHRDIKPANVWLEENTNRVKIVDFGLVRAVADDAELTKSGVILGTPRYMSPEQAQGEKVDQRCDLFSLGSLLYRLVAGKTAFTGTNTTSALIAVAQHDPEPLGNLVPGLNPDFTALIVQLLQKNPNDRPNSAAEVSQRIADIERKLDAAIVPRDATGDTLLDPTETYRPSEPATDSPATSPATPTRSVSEGRVSERSVSEGRRREKRRTPRWLARFPRSRFGLVFAVALLLLPLSYFFGGIVIRFVTNQGLLVVKVDDPNVEIVVRQNGLVVKDKTTRREFQLKAVAGEIEVYDKRGNLRLLTKKFTLARGGKAYVTVTLQELAQARTIEPRPSGSGPWKPTPEQQKFFDAVAKLKPEKQIEAVRARLKLVNPGFDGKLQHKIENGRVVELQFFTDQVTDVSPLRALPGLERLFCHGSNPGKGRLADLSPLQGMPLTDLKCFYARIADLSPLKGMPLTYLECGGTLVVDLSPLQGMPLTDLHFGITRVADLSPLKGMKLTVLGCSDTRISDLSLLQGMPLTKLLCDGTLVSDLSPLQGMKLTVLGCGGTRISDLSLLQGMPLTHMRCYSTRVTDLSPLQGMPLTYLDCGNTRVADLSPLKGMPLTYLTCSSTRVTDLSPLKGMPLTLLHCTLTPVADLSPLQGMQLTTLQCGGTRVADLSPLQGMPLTQLHCYSTPVADLSPLQGMKLTFLDCSTTLVADLSPLQGMPLEYMSWDVRLYNPANETLLKSLPLKTTDRVYPFENYIPVAEFWKQLAARRQAAEEFVESVAKLPAEKQIEAVRSRLKELDRKLDPNSIATLGAKVAGLAVTEATLALTNHPHDLSPLMAFKGLKKLTITGGFDWLDLSPVNALPLEELTCPEPMARKNALVLKGIKTLKTINDQPAAEFWKRNASEIR